MLRGDRGVETSRDHKRWARDEESRAVTVAWPLSSGTPEEGMCAVHDAPRHYYTRRRDRKCRISYSEGT